MQTMDYRRSFYSKIFHVIIPYFISLFYRFRFTSPKVYDILVKSTGMRLKLLLKVTGNCSFPIIDTILLRRLGIYEPETSITLKRELTSGSTVLELGAAEGYFAVQMSNYVGTDGRIYSFEPNRSYYEDLLFNLSLNDCRNVITRNEALGADNEELMDCYGNKFCVASLKEFLHSLERLDFIFIDVDAKTANDLEARQEKGIIDAIVEYIKSQGIRPKIFLEYILRDKSSFDIKNKLLSAGYSMNQVTDRHFLFK